MEASDAVVWDSRNRYLKRQSGSWGVESTNHRTKTGRTKKSRTIVLPAFIELGFIGPACLIGIKNGAT